MWLWRGSKVAAGGTRCVVSAFPAPRDIVAIIVMSAAATIAPPTAATTIACMLLLLLQLGPPMLELL